MFNKELKERFLSSRIDNTKRVYKYILEKAETMETQLDKDIYNFTPDERDSLLCIYPNRSKSTVDVVRSALTRYVKFCIEEGKVSDQINYFELVSSADLDKFVDKTALTHKYITYNELIDISNICINLQDIISLFLAFSGILGETASEIIDLKVKDIHDGKIVLKDREIRIDEKIYDLILKTMDEDLYYSGNGESKAHTQQMTINKTEYLLRTAGKTKSGKVLYSNLMQRVIRMKGYIGNPYLTLKNAWFSGMLHDLRKIKDEGIEITMEHWYDVIEKFGYNPEGIYQLKTKIEQFI